MSTADIVLDSNKQRKRRILWKCALGNTIQDVLNSRIGWAQTRLFVTFATTTNCVAKILLLKTIKSIAKVVTPLRNYLPASYVLPSEYHLFVEEFRKYPPDTIWIMKPVAGAQGKGIFLFKKLKDITEWKKKDRPSNAETSPYVVQSYISRPYLIGGKKFDIRLYVLVTSFRPLNVWVHREGFARFSHSRYSIESFEDAFVHLTNVAIAKSAADYDPERGLKWSLDKLKRYIHATYGIEAVDKLLEKIAGIIIYSLKSVQSLIIQDSHCFELYGYDILLDEDLKPWLLEVLLPESGSRKHFHASGMRAINLSDFTLYRRIGNETNVAGFDLLIKNNESVYRPESTTNASINPECFVPKLNIRLGNYVAPMQMP
uniref:Tubulin--tyrosine ligase-like protein 9 n=1 Tax=Acrobeloides nanus TaxID=290746 RepID=A0A914E5B7_9BILA